MVPELYNNNTSQILQYSEHTVLIYGHYDVQPPEPLEDWPFPPWSAHGENGRIYARGAVDDKENFYCAVKAVESYLRAGRRPPVTVKFWVEGEEVVGSPNVAAFAREHREWLRSDRLPGMDGGETTDGRTEFNLGCKGRPNWQRFARTPSPTSC